MPVGVVLSVLATDRPGLVQRLAEVVADHGGNWVDSSMARLAGEFAGIVRVEVPSSALTGLQAALQSLDADGITVVMRQSHETGSQPGVLALLDLTGGDHPGIVRDISATLAGVGVSIEDLETRVFPGSMSGEHLFSAKARVVLPEDLDIERLRGDLEDLASDLMVEISLNEQV